MRLWKVILSPGGKSTLSSDWSAFASQQKGSTYLFMCGCQNTHNCIWLKKSLMHYCSQKKNPIGGKKYIFQILSLRSPLRVRRVQTKAILLCYE